MNRFLFKKPISLRTNSLSQFKTLFNSPQIWKTQQINFKASFLNSKSQIFFSTKSQSVPLSRLSETFLNGTNSDYVEQMYDAWKKDPNSVHVSWAAYFTNVEKGLDPGKAFVAPPTILPSSYSVSSPESTASQDAHFAIQTARAKELVDSFRQLGHIQSKLDPLGLAKPQSDPRLDYRYYGFTEADLSKEFFIEGRKERLGDIIQRLENTYCGTVGVQFMHLENEAQKNWVRDKIEAPRPSLSETEKKVILDRLLWSTEFENFLKIKFNNDKRFGLDGAEILIPGLKSLIDTAADLGVENIVIGMPHRGRLNVLANVIKKPLAAIMKEFSKPTPQEEELRKADFSFHSGDVKYHLGTSYDRVTRTGKKIHLSLLCNPSHLEAVDPLVEGKARAKQHYTKDTRRKKTMSLQLHGDAAFAGQGVVYETFQMSGVPDFTTGGSVHVIVNNQIGFTTDPVEGRCTRYCTDIGKAFDLPIIHVNCDDTESVIFSFKLAAEWRHQFGKDIIIDLVAFRRFGHNELDEPKFTQPLMYSKIEQHPGGFILYRDKLLKEGSITEDIVKQLKDNAANILGKAYQEAPKFQTKKSDWFDSPWHGFKSPEQLARIKPTGVKVEMLKKVGKAISNIPETFKPHPVVARDLKRKQQMFETGKDVDWSTAEALAFGTLLLEGNHVRLSGQDVERGTFSHRHAVLSDQVTNEKYVPLQNIDPNQAEFIVANSILSEFGVLGFELGYSLENPNSLILWEAQFGDFANGAQVIIDQFLSCEEQKWERQNGLCLLLPHGYDGQGPEHSSARLERFLQLSNSDPSDVPLELVQFNPQLLQHKNWVVANVTTPANYFHLLRRQVHREFRKPLVLMSPKYLLRIVKSDLSEFEDDGSGIRFKKVIPEVENLDIAKVKKLVFCSGQIYYKIIEERTKRGVNNMAVVRVEQLMPFPFYEMTNELKKYPNAKIIWCQEEHKNMGAWSYMQPHITYLLDAKDFSKISYVGRAVSSSPATGKLSIHQMEHQVLMNQLFE